MPPWAKPHVATIGRAAPRSLNCLLGIFEGLDETLVVGGPKRREEKRPNMEWGT